MALKLMSGETKETRTIGRKELLNKLIQEEPKLIWCYSLTIYLYIFDRCLKYIAPIMLTNFPPPEIFVGATMKVTSFLDSFRSSIYIMYFEELKRWCIVAVTA